MESRRLKTVTLEKRLKTRTPAMAAYVLLNTVEREVCKMRCPACGNEMAYSVLAHGFLCLAADCGIELDVDPCDVEEILQPAEELVLV
jgi:hypothetical protein